MRLLIQVSSRPACGAAQPAITALNAVLTVTVKASDRTVRARREEIRKPSSGITPRISGVISEAAESRDVMAGRIAGWRPWRLESDSTELNQTLAFFV